MSKLTTKLAEELKFDIVEFNEHVTILEKQLLCNNEKSNDLFMHVLNAYSSCKDANFKDKIKARRCLYESGDIPLELDDLLIFGKTQFNRLQQMDTYLKPTEDQEQIIALTAQLQQERLERSKLKSSQGSGTPSSNDRRQNRDRAAWMTKAPADGEPHEKVVDGKTYFYCKEHKCWGLHKDSECRKCKKRLEARGSTAAPATNSHDSAPTESSDPLRATIASVLKQSNE